jgi:hypothetical protein
MDYINEAILNHLRMKTTGALLLTGDWGSGKTYYLKNSVFPLIERETKFIPVIVSLYGETDKNNIAQKVLFAFFDKKGKDVNLSTGTIAKNIKNLADGFPILKKYVDLDKLIVGTGENVFRLLPHDNLFICFDDLERMSEKVDVNDFLGIINDLVENKGCKVLLIANEKEIKNGIAFKEKTIEKTIHFAPHFSSIYDSIVGTYENSPFKDYLINNKDFILSSLNPKTEQEEDEKELSKSFSNIRTLKFAIEHFKYPFLLLTSKKDLGDDLTIKQLKSIWLFTLSISIEFRKPNNISYTDRKKLDVQTASVSNIALGSLDFDDNPNKGKSDVEDSWSYSEEFKRLYYDRLSEAYIFFPGIYDLITSGKEIFKEDFISHLEQSFNVKEGKIHPAHSILNRLMYTGYWTFSNEEFRTSLKELLNHVDNGELGDLVSYLNAGVYLLNFNELINIDKDTIVTKLKNGVSKILNQVELNDFVTSQFEFISEKFEEGKLESVVAFIKEKFSKIEEENAQKEVEKLQQLLASNVELFVKELLPNNSGLRTPYKPLLHKFNKQIVMKAVGSWEPKDIMNISSLLKIRYLESSFSERLTEEITFLKYLEDGIGQIDLNQKLLSNNLIKDQLLSSINKSKLVLDRFKLMEPKYNTDLPNSN